MSKNKGKPGIRNVAEVPWQQFPDHFGGALSKALVGPGNTDITLIDYRISSYQPMARVAAHTHKVQEQIYHVQKHLPQKILYKSQIKTDNTTNHEI